MLNLFNFHSNCFAGEGGEVKLKHRSNMSTFFILSTCCCVVGEAGQNQTWLNNAQHINFVHILNLLLCRGRGCKFKTNLTCQFSSYFSILNVLLCGPGEFGKYLQRSICGGDGGAGSTSLKLTVFIFKTHCQL